MIRQSLKMLKSLTWIRLPL